MTPKRENGASSWFHPESFPLFSSGYLLPSLQLQAVHVAFCVPPWVGAARTTTADVRQKKGEKSFSGGELAASSGCSVTGLGSLKNAHLMRLLVTGLVSAAVASSG